MKSPLGPALCACLLIPTPTHAQSTLVSPAYFASHEADSYSFYPFAQYGSTVTRHHQAVHDLGSAFKKRLYALGYRRDRGHSYQPVTVPSWWVQLEVALSTSPTTSARMASTFASNEGKDRKVVVKNKKVSFSQFSQVGRGPQPFFYVIPFDAGSLFQFNGGSLTVDIKTHDSNVQDIVKKVGAWYFDAVRNTTGVTQVPIGTGCSSSGGFSRGALQVQWASYSPSQNQFSYRSIVYYGPRGANLTGLQAFSVTTLPGNGTTLPGGCPLYLDPATLLGTLVGKTISGFGTFGFPPYKSRSIEYWRVPWVSTMKGAVVYAQSFIPDAKANSLGLVTSNAAQITLPVHNPFGYAVSHLSTSSLTATSSRVNRNHGLITQFHGL